MSCAPMAVGVASAVVPALFEFIANWADLLWVAARVGDDRLSLTEFGAGFESVESYCTP